MPSRKLLLLTLAVMALALSWQCGVYQGQQQASVGGSAALIHSQGTALAELAQARSEIEILRATEVALRDDLSNAMRMSADDRAELELYRSIANSKASTGLLVDRVTYVTGDDAGSAGRTVGDRLDITLVQARGRGRVSGRVEVVLLRDGETLARVSEAVDGTPADFDLRFFQTIGLPLDLDVYGKPDSLQIDVLLDPGTVHEDFVDKRDWALVSQ